MSKKEEKTAKEVKEENTPEPQEKKVIEKRKSVATLVAGSDGWDFTEQPIFIGSYVKEHIVKTDDNPEGKRMGLIFKDEEGEDWVLPDWHAINKGLTTEFDHPETDQVATVLHLVEIGESPLVQIEFVKEGLTKKGKKYFFCNVDVVELFDNESDGL